MTHRAHIGGLLAFAWFAGVACERFDPPPEARIENNENGVMTTAPDQPLVVLFSESFLTDSLALKIVPAVFDGEGNLLDEQSPPKLDEFRESTLIAFDGARQNDENASYGAAFELSADKLVITPTEPLAWSAPFLALIEPGLEDHDGHATVPRNRIPFTYQLPGGGPNSLPNGYYYFLINVEYLATQIQTYTYLEADAVTGVWRAIFTNANRRPELNTRAGCPSCSGDTPICALIPDARCVKPSDKQNALDEFKDFLPETDPPDGYTFVASGFARDEPNGSIAIGTAPFLIDVTIGSGGINVRAEGTTMTGAFEEDAGGRLVASGSISVDVIKLNGQGASGTAGQFTAMKLTDEEVAEVEAFGFPVPTDLD
jgi:hypothetical protein